MEQVLVAWTLSPGVQGQRCCIPGVLRVVTSPGQGPDPRRGFSERGEHVGSNPIPASPGAFCCGKGRTQQVLEAEYSRFSSAGGSRRRWGCGEGALIRPAGLWLCWVCRESVRE